MAISNSIKTKAIDAGQNFLTGQATTLFAASGVEVVGGSIYNLADDIQNKLAAKVEDIQNGAMQVVSSAGAGLGSAFGTVVGIGDNAIMQLTTMSDMAQEMVTDMAKETLDKVTKETQEIVTGASSYLVQRVSYYSQTMLQEEIKKITDKYLTNSDEKQSQEVSQKKDSWMNNAMSKVTDAVNMAQSKVQEGVDALNKGAEQISALAAEGPQWAANQLNSLHDSVSKTVNTFIDDKVKDIKEKRDAELDKIAATVAKHTVKPTIDAVAKKIDKLWNETNKSKAKVTQKAKTLIQKAKFKLSALTGIAPI